MSTIIETITTERNRLAETAAETRARIEADTEFLDHTESELHKATAALSVFETPAPPRRGWLVRG